MIAQKDNMPVRQLTARRQAPGGRKIPQLPQLSIYQVFGA